MKRTSNATAWERMRVGCPPPHRHARSYSKPAIARWRRGASALAQRRRLPTGGADEVMPHGSDHTAPVCEWLTRLPLWRAEERRGGRQCGRPRATHGRPPDVGRSRRHGGGGGGRRDRSLRGEGVASAQRV